LKRTLIYTAILIQSFLLLEGCTSRSELKEKAAKKQFKDQPARSDRSKKQPERQEIIGKVNTDESNLVDLFKNNKKGVFLIYTSDGDKTFQGTGFFISQGGIGISNYHVFEGTSQGLEVIKLSNGQQLKIERIIKKDEENDYIIFQVKTNSKVSYLSIAQNLPSIGEEVFAIGNPKGLEQTLSQGIISGYREDMKYLQTTTEITNGSSGGPLLNMKGQVVGITTAGYGEANLNFAINIKKLNLNRVLN
jgi:serine protease Do